MIPAEISEVVVDAVASRERRQLSAARADNDLGRRRAMLMEVAVDEAAARAEGDPVPVRRLLRDLFPGAAGIDPDATVPQLTARRLAEAVRGPVARNELAHRGGPGEALCSRCGQATITFDYGTQFERDAEFCPICGARFEGAPRSASQAGGNME